MNFFSLLETHPAISDFRSNVPIDSESGFRLGEADCIFRLQGKLCHLEIAVKFYLCIEPEGSEDAALFVGHRLKDTLAKKITRIETHQLEILKQSQDPDLQAAESMATVSGILFYPYRAGLKLPSFSKPSSIEPTHTRGIWTHAREFDRLIRTEKIEKGLFIHEKSAWIRKPKPQELVEASNLSDRIHDHFKDSVHPIQCEILNPYSPRSDHEPPPLIRVFVMRDGWPEIEKVDPTP